MLIAYRRLIKILKEKIIMDSPGRIVENIVVLGAGALGFALAFGREQFLKGEGRCQLFFFNRTRLFKRATLSGLGKDSPEQDFSQSCLPHTHFTADFLRGLVGIEPDTSGACTARLSVWVTVPPPTLDSTCIQLTKVALEILHSVSMQKAFHRCPGMDIWICSNGCLSDEVMSRLFEIQGPLVSLNRALFLTGFESDWDPETGHMMVRHTGGSDVLWGDIGSIRSPEPHRERGSDCKPGLAAPFQLRRVDGIQTVEMQKFFVNMVLGWVVGPHELTNGSLLQSRSAVDLEKLAEAFTSLFPIAGSAEAILDLLMQTVLNTAHNVNSVSRAWHRGKPENARYFRDFVLNAQGKSGRHDPIWNDFFCRHLLSESDSGQ